MLLVIVTPLVAKLCSSPLAMPSPSAQLILALFPTTPRRVHMPAEHRRIDRKCNRHSRCRSSHPARVFLAAAAAADYRDWELDSYCTTSTLGNFHPQPGFTPSKAQRTEHDTIMPQQPPVQQPSASGGVAPATGCDQIPNRYARANCGAPHPTYA